MLEFDNGRHAAKSRHSLDQDFLPLAVKFGRKDADTCCIAAGPGQRIYQSRPDHILGNPEDRNRCRRLLCRTNCGITADINVIDMGFDQACHKFGNQINAPSIVAPFDREVLALDEAKPPKFIERREPIGRIAWTDGHAAEAISPARFLRQRSERPCDTRANERDKLAPSHVAPVIRSPCRLAPIMPMAP